jgi:hypothetical protein
MRLFSLILVLALFPAAGSEAAPPLSHNWSKIFGDAQTQDARACAADPSGNVWITGRALGVVNFGLSSSDFGTTNDGMYLVKYSSSGTNLVIKGWGYTTNQFGTALACDLSGNVILAGSFSNTINVGGGIFTSFGGNDIILAKFNSAGTHVWSKQFGDPSTQVPNGVAVDAAGNVYVTGFFQGTVNFGGGGLVSTGGSTDIFLAKYDPAGNHVWSKRFGETATQNAVGIAVSASGDVAITGLMAGSADFGGGLITSAGSNDTYVARFNTAGSYVFAKRFGDSVAQVGNAIGFDPSGNVVAAGHFLGTIDFGGGALTTAGGNDVYLVKLDPAGNHVWSKRFGDASAQTTSSVVVDGGGAIVLTGSMAGTTNFGGGNLTSAGGNDIFLARFDNDGTHIWSARYGDGSDQHPACVRVDAANNIVLAGDVFGTTDFGGGPLVASGQDIFLARFIRAYPEIHNIVDVPGDQGGWVRVYVQGSGQDLANSSPQVTAYNLFRRVDNALAMQVANEGITGPSHTIDWKGRHFWQDPSSNAEAAALILWESVGSAPARQQSTDYIILAPTQADQTASATPYQKYFVMAQTTSPSVFYDSDPDSGYSVDNLAPATPQNLAGASSSSPAGLALSWSGNSEHDLNHYAVYRGSSAGFVPSSGNLIASPVGASFLDAGWTSASGHYYKVSAVDHHDNQSGFALLTPAAVTGADPSLPVSTYLDQNFPNPFNPSTTISFGLDTRSEVALRIYDSSGALVRALVAGERPAGAHVANWDGRDDAGRAVATGIYYCRLDAGGKMLTRKMLLLK